MRRTITTKALALVLGAIAAIGLVSVPARSARATGRQCVKLDTAPLEPGRDYEVFPNDLDLTMQSLQAAIMRRDSQPALKSVDYVVVPDDLDATMQSLQGALAEREIAHHGTVTLVKC